MRLVPIFPYTIADYLLGLTRFPFHHYLFATVVFMVPSTVAYTWMGYAGREALVGRRLNCGHSGCRSCRRMRMPDIIIVIGEVRFSI